MTDLHMHTTASDGRCTPTELVDRVVAAGITVMAVTDHDTTAAVAEVQSHARARGIEAHARYRDHRGRGRPGHPHARLLPESCRAAFDRVPACAARHAREARACDRGKAGRARCADRSPGTARRGRSATSAARSVVRRSRARCSVPDTSRIRKKPSIDS